MVVMRSNVATALLLAAAATSASAHGHHHHHDAEADNAYAAEARLARRQAPNGATCGPPSNTICGAGLCCSPNNVCGTGIAYCGAPGCQLSFGPQCDGNQEPTGKDTSNVPRPLFGNVPYGVSLYHCTINGYVALTFDDGPYIYTSDLLDLLQKNNVTATFFVVGANGGKGQIENESTGYPAIIQRMILEGHQVGSHTWSHQDLANLTSIQRHEQIIWNEMAFVDILGFFPTYLRPPYTDWNQQTLNDLQALGYHVMNYDIDTRDWQGNYTYAQSTFTTILQQHSPSSSSWISLAHDIENQTVHGFAQYMINQARQLGYKLVRVGDCLGDPEPNWYRDPTTGQPFNVTKAFPSLSAALASATATSGSSTTPSPAAGSGSAPATMVPASTSPAVSQSAQSSHATPSSPGSLSSLSTASPQPSASPKSSEAPVSTSSHFAAASPTANSTGNFEASSGNTTVDGNPGSSATAVKVAAASGTASSKSAAERASAPQILVLLSFACLGFGMLLLL